MKAAKIDAGVVVNAIIVPDAETAERFDAVPCPDEVGIGWGYDGAAFVAPSQTNPLAALSEEDFADHTRAACRSRILSICSASAQANMAAFITAGMAVDGDVAAYQGVVKWIDEMRAASKKIISERSNFLDDGAWPSLNKKSTAFAARF